MSRYQAISCSLHSQLELAIIQKKSSLISTITESSPFYIIPLDIIIEDKSEFLLASDSKNDVIKIRLDQILSFS